MHRWPGRYTGGPQLTIYVARVLPMGKKAEKPHLTTKVMGIVTVCFILCRWEKTHFKHILNSGMHITHSHILVFWMVDNGLETESLYAARKRGFFLITH